MLSAKSYCTEEPLEVKGTEDESKESPVLKSPSRRLSALVLSILCTDEGQEDRCSSASQKLVKYLADLTPDERSELVDNLQVQHYLHRLVQHGAKNDKHDEVIGKLAEYFPSEIEDYQKKELPISYSYSDVDSKKVRTSIAMTRSGPTAAADIFQYDPNSLAATFRAPKLTLENVKRASVAVALEVKTLEKAITGSDISPANRSLSVGMYGLKRLPPSSVPKRSSYLKNPAEKTKLVPVLRSELDDPHFKVSKSGKSLFPQRRREPTHLNNSWPRELLLKDI